LGLIMLSLREAPRAYCAGRDEAISSGWSLGQTKQSVFSQVEAAFRYQFDFYEGVLVAGSVDDVVFGSDSLSVQALVL